MGNLSSSSIDPLEVLREQLKHLGNRYPFGDDEILRLSRCYAYIDYVHRKTRQDGKTKTDSSHDNDSLLTGRFLSDWAVFCPSLDKPNFKATPCEYTNILQVDPSLLTVEHQNTNSPSIKSDEISSTFITRMKKWQRSRYELMKIIEDKILTPGFGNILQRKIFEVSNTISNITEQSTTDEFISISMERLENFFNGAAECSRRGSRKALMVIFKCMSSNDGHAFAKDLINLCYRLSLATSVLTSCTSLEGKELLETIPSFFPQGVEESPLTKSLLEYEKQSPHAASETYDFTMNGNGSVAGHTTPPGTVSMETFIAWTESSAPCLSATLESFMHYIFFPDVSYPPSRTEFLFPDIKSQKNAFFPLENRSSTLLFSFASMSPSLGGSWHRIFTTESDGLSFNRLQNSLLGYGGPTLLIIREVASGGIFGAFSSTPWKESKDFYGNSDCFLFRIYPTVKVMRPRGIGENYMYCNSASRSKNYDGLSHGIGFGGNTEKPRLYIAESFDGCTASAADLTFEAGALLPPPTTAGVPATKFFEIEALEVWGVGGDEVVAEALGARHKQREVVAANIRKARKVDKAAFLDDFKSGLIESKAFQHRDQIRGREGCHVDDEDTNNYIYEK